MKSSLLQTLIRKEEEHSAFPVTIYRIVLPWCSSPILSDWHLRMHLQQIGWCSRLAEEHLVHEQMLFFLYLWSECDKPWPSFCTEYHDSFQIVPLTTVDAKRKYLWIHHDDSEEKAFPMRLFDIFSMSSFIDRKKLEEIATDQACPLIGQVAQW